MSQFKQQRTQGLTRTQHEDGKKDAWNRHAQVASQAMTVPEEYGPDAERQVKRDENKNSEQVKKTTLGRARREERDHQSEFGKTKSNETILKATNVEKSFRERNKEGSG